jgi:hypothetical protein
LEEEEKNWDAAAVASKAEPAMRTMEVVEEGAMVVVAKRFLWRT